MSSISFSSSGSTQPVPEDSPPHLARTVTPLPTPPVAVGILPLRGRGLAAGVKRVRPEDVPSPVVEALPVELRQPPGAPIKRRCVAVLRIGMPGARRCLDAELAAAALAGRPVAPNPPTRADGAPLVLRDASGVGVKRGPEEDEFSSVMAAPLPPGAPIKRRRVGGAESDTSVVESAVPVVRGSLAAAEVAFRFYGPSGQLTDYFLDRV
ncbi:MAG: hypothetical protein JSR76_04380 [Verrucomicrobia bacterium]|nr:hypothetical protein [Verrucomicrobiota bacterium]